MRHKTQSIAVKWLAGGISLGALAFLVAMFWPGGDPPRPDAAGEDLPSKEKAAIAIPQPKTNPKETAPEEPEPPNAPALKAELAEIEAEFEALRPVMTAEYQAWKKSRDDLDHWIEFSKELSRWETEEEPKLTKAVNRWWYESSGRFTAEREEQYKQARRPIVAEGLRAFLSDPDSSEQARAFLKSKLADGEILENEWSAGDPSLPPRSIVEEMLSNENAQPQFPKTEGVPDFVEDYARIAFQKKFQQQLVSGWIQGTRPESLRKVQERWNELNERRHSILLELGQDPRTITKY